VPTLKPAVLQDFAGRLLAAGGMTSAEAEVTSASLVGANLRGYDSHGVMRIPYYVQSIAEGETVSQAKLEIRNEGPARIVANANWGVGQVQAVALLKQLVPKARESGVAIASVTQCGHIGRLGEYCELAAAEGLVSMLMVNSHGGAARVAPPGGKLPRLSTNPLAIGVPHGDTPLVLDFSTSATAEGKVRVKKIAGQSVPEGWLLDSEGRPTTDPNLLYGNPPGSILPMGGPGQTYKGFGLGLMVEIFTGALSGGVCARPVPHPKKGNCVFMMLIDPDRFGGNTCFAAEVQQLVDYVRCCPTVDGCAEILLPGDPERRLLAKRMAEGITLDSENFAALAKLAGQLGVPVPRD
jgi:hydroxycarboxylate dehydrogenase B